MRSHLTFFLAGLMACGSTVTEPDGTEPAVSTVPPADVLNTQPTDEPPDAPAKPESTDEAAAEAPANLVSVTTLKNGSIEDIHTMVVDASKLVMKTPGDVDTLGGIMAIQLNSWTSPITVRDERVKEMFFKVADNPAAAFQLQGVSGIGTLEDGASGQGKVKGTLSLFSGFVPVEANISVTRTGERYAVSLLNPVEIKASALNLAEGLQAVATACGVELADATKVTANFSF